MRGVAGLELHGQSPNASLPADGGTSTAAPPTRTAFAGIRASAPGRHEAILPSTTMPPPQSNPVTPEFADIGPHPERGAVIVDRQVTSLHENKPPQLCIGIGTVLRALGKVRVATEGQALATR
jgi:hypothetical protein